ncbi:MAG: FecR family protein [Synergistaceae bacterium]|jgi:hypothetical protein|nr:FecR family protein [Synergistaceae bacterium]
MMIVKRAKYSVFLMSCVLCLFFAVCGVSFAAGDGIGMVSAVEGRAVARRNGADVALALKDRVFENDAITASAGAKVQILLDDDSAITIAQDSTIQISDFLDSGSDSKFSAHLAEGRARIVTGRITENNSEGFKVTTKHAAIGIRGTILTVTATDDETQVEVENTDKVVYVNDVAVPEFQRAIIREGEAPELTPTARGLTSPESASLDPVSPEETSPEEAENVALPSLEGGLAEQTAPNMKTPGSVIPAYARASGTLSNGTGEISGNFGFKLDLQTGDISEGNIVMSGRDISNYYDMDMSFYNGKGKAGSGGFRVEDFAGTITVTANGHSIDTGIYTDGGSYIAGTDNLLKHEGDFNVNAFIQAEYKEATAPSLQDFPLASESYTGSGHFE